MQLMTPAQHDALSEIANIGASRSAKQLSLLLDDEIYLSVPEVAIVSVAELPGAIGVAVTDDVACVYQGHERLSYRQGKTDIPYP